VRVLIIPEDFTYDQYILRPLFTRLFAELGKPRAKLVVCREPNLGGVEEALKVERLREIMANYPMTDLFVLCVDRDGESGRRARLDQLEEELGPRFIAENAWEELETWTLAGLRLPSRWRWQEIRAEPHVKEKYFEPLARDRDLSDLPDGGRAVLTREAVRNMAAIRRKCPEFDGLARRIQKLVDDSPAPGSIAPPPTLDSSRVRGSKATVVDRFKCQKMVKRGWTWVRCGRCDGCRARRLAIFEEKMRSLQRRMDR